jgi:hypothetical protein
MVIATSSFKLQHMARGINLELKSISRSENVFCQRSTALASSGRRR